MVNADVLITIFFATSITLSGQLPGLACRRNSKDVFTMMDILQMLKWFLRLC